MISRRPPSSPSSLPGSSTAGGRATRALSIMLTRRCNMACTHCSVESSPKVQGAQPGDRELLDLIREAAAAGVTSVLLTGGEPMMRGRLVLRLLREVRRRGMSSALVTNGFWGRQPAAASRWMKALIRAGLGRLTVSYDRYHAEFQGPDAAVNIVRAAEAWHIPVNINVTRVAGEDLASITAPFDGLRTAQLRFYDVQPVGAAARSIGDDEWRTEAEGFCNACDSASITDDGRIMACNGPSYFVGPQHPLHVGSVGREPLADLLRRHHEDPILDTLRTGGPARLRRELLQISGFEQFPFRDRYRGLCDLCHHVTSDPAAVAALRERLAAPRLAAEREAMRRIIQDQHRAGRLNRAYVNTVGAARLFHRAALRPDAPLSAESSRLLGRADLDWQHQARYLSACGLSRPLLAALDDPALRRWAPPFFAQRLREAALRDGMRELMQIEALRTLAAAARTLGVRGVLLKGAANLALQNERPSHHAIRAAGDIDLYVPAESAPALRNALLDDGFAGTREAGPSGPHHLAPVSWRGVSVEIHTRLMPACWGLPERQMLERARALAADGFEPLDTLDAEGMLLHTATHASTHVFTHGLKTAWDIAFLLDREGASLDWDRLGRWVGMTSVPRAFWTPARALAAALDLPVPQGVLAGAPADRRQRQLEIIAQRRLFSAFEGAFELNPFSRTAVFLMMHDGPVRRAGYLLWLLRSDAAAARRSARRTTTTQRLRDLPQQLGEAAAQWRQYRAAVPLDTSP